MNIAALSFLAGPRKFPPGTSSATTVIEYSETISLSIFVLTLTSPSLPMSAIIKASGTDSLRKKYFKSSVSRSSAVMVAA